MALELLIGTNTFVNLNYANLYMLGKFNGEDWFNLNLETRKKLLITAFRWLIAEGIQRNAVNVSIKYAQVELAWWINNYIIEQEKREALIAGGVVKFKLSNWEEELSKVDLPEKIKKMVAAEIGIGGYFCNYNRELEN